ncbi:hypothetical protein HYZ05_02970 [Candidatus Daviesbacteria bacterium]|nr:hypothetical protein [Candidatus Daviesbacteria bacterium]
MTNSYFYINKDFLIYYDPGLFLITKSAALVGIYILVIGLISFLEWKREKNNLSLLAVFVGPFFSLLFFGSMWVVLGNLLDGYSSMHYYNVIPSLGISLFLAAIFSLIYKKIKKFPLSQYISIATFSLLLLFFYSSNLSEIQYDFNYINKEGVSIKDQTQLHVKLKDILKQKNLKGNALIYFEIPESTRAREYYTKALSLNNFGAIIYSIIDDNKWEGCIAASINPSLLEELENLKDVIPGLYIKDIALI